MLDIIPSEVEETNTSERVGPEIPAEITAKGQEVGKKA